MNFQCVSNVFVHHSLLIYFTTIIVSLTCLIISITLKSFPSFSDPQAGFETRGTPLSDRIKTWEYLVENTKESGSLTANPNEYLSRFDGYNSSDYIINIIKKRASNDDNVYAKIKLYQNNTTDVHDINWSELKRISVTGRNPGECFSEVFDRKFFCGAPNEGYSHIVLEADKGVNLFTLEQLQKLCRIEYEMTEPKIYRNFCVRTGPNEPNECCKPWSLANYIAFLRNKQSCLAITEEDVRALQLLLQDCASYYHSFNLTEKCLEENNCDVPVCCKVHDAVFNILNYITPASYLVPDDVPNLQLEKTIIFLPLAVSAEMLPYYHELRNRKFDYEDVKIVAMQFGTKNALFEECIVNDTWLMTLGGSFILLCMWFYTGSFFLTIVSLMSIVFSLSISYFVYTIVYQLTFFPFINFLVVVILLGIGADDIFIFSAEWRANRQNVDNSLVTCMADTLNNYVTSVGITSATTSTAFFSSYINSVVAVRCFSLFSSTAILVNCFMMIFFCPISIVIMEKVINPCCITFNNYILTQMHGRFFFSQNSQRTLLSVRINMRILWDAFENSIIKFIIRLPLIIFIVLTIVAIISGFIVFCYPKMQLPNTPEFQLFQSSHVFEQYDLIYKNLFWFTKTRRTDSTLDSLPLTFVWGVLPQDNGDYLEPQSFGSLVFDDSFNMSHPNSQIWLLKFCKDLKKQPFYQSTRDPLHTNCFIEWFVKWMKTSCHDSMELKDRSPCCKSETFPFKNSVFNYCLKKAIAYLHETPYMYFRPGMQGPKFFKDENAVLKAIVVQYDSNYVFSVSYDYMHGFITEVEAWFHEVMLTAPPTMRGGWFVSDLGFYELQSVLSESTLTNVVISVILSFIVLNLATFNIVITFFAVLNIICSTLVTMAILVLLGWKLNVLESVAMSTAIGLTVDFSLHYTVKYKSAPPGLQGNRVDAVRYAISKMLEPITMSALTTAVAGFFIMFSSILVYIQIGTFLVIVVCVTWVYSTFHLGTLLTLIGPQNDFGQYNLKWLKRDSGPLNANPRNRRNETTPSESHELDELTENRSHEQPCCSRSLHRISSDDKNVISEQTPSTVSAISATLVDDN